MLEVKHLTKRYGGYTAVSDLSFSIEKGQIYGFLGPNGAGKSTTMNIITGCLAATEGDVAIDGHDIFEEASEAKKLIGYLPEIPPLYLDMTPRAYLQFVARAKGVEKDAIDGQIENSINVTQIQDVADRQIKNLSKGYKQRVGIAQALIGDPELIILDEPTVGLDPIQIIEIRDLIKSLGKTHTVILSSHILSEVRAICDHILIISKGKMVACDTPENLEKLFAGETVLNLVAEAEEAEVRSALSGIGEIREIKYEKEDDGCAGISIETDGSRDIRRDVFFAFCEIKRPILSMSTTRASLEDVFIELTGNKDEVMENSAAELSEDDNAAKAGEEAKEDESDIQQGT